jgi:hypothetical protein
VTFFRERGAQARVRSFSVCTSSIRSRLSPVQVVNRAAVPDKSRLFPPAARNALLAELVNTGRFLGNTQNTVRMLAHAKYIGNTFKHAQIYRSRFYVSRHGSQPWSACYVLREVRFVTHTLTHDNPTKL